MHSGRCSLSPATSAAKIAANLLSTRFSAVETFFSQTRVGRKFYAVIQGDIKDRWYNPVDGSAAPHSRWTLNRKLRRGSTQLCEFRRGVTPSDVGLSSPGVRLTGR